MQPLQKNIELLKAIGIYWPNEKRPLREKIQSAIVLSILLICLGFGVSSSFVYVIKYVMIDPESALYALFQIAAMLSVLNQMLATFFCKNRIDRMLKSFQIIHAKVIDSSKDFYSIFIKVNGIGARITKILTKYVLLVNGMAIFTVSLLNFSYCYYQYGQIEPDCLVLFYKFSAPWDQSSPIFRSATMFYCVFQTMIYSIANSVILSFFIVTCLQFYAFRIYFKGLISEINAEAADSLKLKIMFRDLIQFHLTIKDIFWNSSQVFNTYAVNQFFMGILFMSSNVLNMDMALRHLDIYFFMLLLVTINSLSNLYIYCYAGTFTTTNFELLENNPYDAQWYLMPNNIKKCLILIIKNAKQPFTYDGFHLASLDLITFAKVLKTVSSYYLMLKATFLK